MASVYTRRKWTICAQNITVLSTPYLKAKTFLEIGHSQYKLWPLKLNLATKTRLI